MYVLFCIVYTSDYISSVRANLFINIYKPLSVVIEHWKYIACMLKHLEGYWLCPWAICNKLWL